MKKRIALAVLAAALLALVAPGAAWAQVKGKVAATLEYYEDNSGDFEVLDAAGKVIAPEFGLELKQNWLILTKKGDVAEIKLQHNNTIIKVAQNTNFKVVNISDQKGSPNEFTVTLGKIRMVAGKATGKEEYRVNGNSAVCGVSGTDLVFEVDLNAGDEKLFTLEGKVKFSIGDQTLEVLKGMMSSLKDFKVVQIPTDLFENLIKGNPFQKLDPAAVPQLLTSGVDQGEQAGQTPPPPMTSSALDDIMAKVREVLGMEIGSVTIDGVTWSKVVVQPNFRIGKLGLGLYLPLIYSGDMFNPADWYKPEGNNEWSFGTDQSPGDVVAIVGDVFSDTVLKIKYLEWGDNRDPFFFKVGNLNDITVGHGLIMRNFANDAEFPSVRRVGLNLGFDMGGFGFEWMVNDAANFADVPLMFADPAYQPDLVTGGRVYVRPIPGFKAALGVSLLADLGPAANFSDGSYTPVDAGLPIFLNPGVDLDLPFVETDLLSIVAFADAALMLPYFRTAPNIALTGGVSVPAGLARNAVWNPAPAAGEMPFKNYGVAAGLFGNVLFVDWRLEYRYFTGTFKPAFYNTGYERSRSQYVSEVLDYLGDTANPAYNARTMGIYGEGGFRLNKIMSLDLGYFWPWDTSGTLAFTDMQDRFIAKFVLEPGVIPVVNISGSVSYERTDFMTSILGGGSPNLFDANTVVKAELMYPVAPTLDVVLFYTTTAKHDGSGNIIYEPGEWLPELSTTLTFETRVHF